MPKAPRKPPGKPTGKPRSKPASALPDEAQWAAEREHLAELDAQDASAAAAAEQPVGGPTPKGSPTGPAAGMSMPSLPKPTLKLPTSMPSSTDVASLLTGLLIYTLFLNYLRYGGTGVKGWVMAKFMNSPLDAAALGAAAASQPGPSIDTGPTAPLTTQET